MRPVRKGLESGHCRTDTRTNCKSVGCRGGKNRNLNQRLREIAALMMLARVFSGFCERAQRVKFRSSFGAGDLPRRRDPSRSTERLNGAQRHRSREPRT